MANILITGGSGLIGKTLISKLLKENHSVSILSRSSKKIKNVATYLWNINSEEIDDNAFNNIDFIIHLAGAGIADIRWTQKRKQEIIDSRVKSTQLLYKKVKENQVQLKGFISSSAIGYYGAVTSDKEFTETDDFATDFLGTVCHLWEKSILQFKKADIQTTIFRTGIVLSNNGGALAKMKTPVVTPIDSGKQWMPWIHIDDLCQMYLDAVNGKLNGIYNAVAPEHITNYSFSKLFAKSIKRLFLRFGPPSFLLRMLFGELSIILLTGSKISSKRILDAGFKFKYPNLESAFRQIYSIKKGH